MSPQMPGTTTHQRVTLNLDVDSDTHEGALSIIWAVLMILPKQVLRSEVAGVTTVLSVERKEPT